MGEFVTAGHLGGYVAGGDPDTYCPALWNWLVQEYGVGSMLDVGCGDGATMDYFAELGCYVHGVDGVIQENPRILCWDYTHGPRLFFSRDLVWSCEFVEHVEEQYVSNFLATFECARLLLMTHAEPGQPGWHHVNCQPASYWINRIEEIGLSFDPELTMRTRSLATVGATPGNYYVKTGLAFIRTRAVEEKEIDV